MQISRKRPVKFRNSVLKRLSLEDFYSYFNSLTLNLFISLTQATDIRLGTSNEIRLPRRKSVTRSSPRTGFFLKLGHPGADRAFETFPHGLKADRTTEDLLRPRLERIVSRQHIFQENSGRHILNTNSENASELFLNPKIRRQIHLLSVPPSRMKPTSCLETAFLHHFMVHFPLSSFNFINFPLIET